MKTLLFARHAKSDWDDLRMPDHDRPLSPRGERDAPAMAKRLVDEGVPLDVIVSSSAARALATATEYARAYGIDPDAIVIEPALYGASPRTILAVAAALPESVDAAMVVGHNPGMSGAPGELTGDWLDLPTCAVVETRVPSWAEIGEETGTLIAVRTPSDP